MLRQKSPLRRKTPLRAKTPIKRTAMKKRPKRRQPTKHDKDYMAWVATLPCSVLNLHCRGRTTVHHCQGYQYRGIGQKAPDTKTIPLCEAHHLFGQFSIEQMGIRAWEKVHGSQADHLAKTEEKYRIKELTDGNR